MTIERVWDSFNKYQLTDINTQQILIIFLVIVCIVTTFTKNIIEEQNFKVKNLN